MSKLLLFVVLGVVVWWMWRKLQRPGQSSMPRQARPAELMVSCAHCGVNQPRSECVESGGRLYCSESHRQAAERGAAGG